MRILLSSSLFALFGTGCFEIKLSVGDDGLSTNNVSTDESNTETSNDDGSSDGSTGESTPGNSGTDDGDWGWDSSGNQDPNDPSNPDGTWPDDAWQDTDGDGLSDQDEYYYGTDPENPDTDGDGASDLEEIYNGTDPWNPDTDGDGVLDGDDTEYSDSNGNTTNPDGSDPWGWDESVPSDGGSGNPDDPWDWGDSNSGDISDFEGNYPSSFQLYNSVTGVLVCQSTFTTEIDTVGEVLSAGSCTAPNGQVLNFDLDGSIYQYNNYGSTGGIYYGGFSQGYIEGEGTISVGTESLDFPFYGECYADDGSGQYLSSVYLYWNLEIIRPNGRVNYYYATLSGYMQ